MQNRLLSLIAVVVLLGGFCACTAVTESKDLLFDNPVVKQRADPWAYLHTDGYYYMTASVPEYDRLEIRRSKTIKGLGKAESKVVWRKHDNA